MKLKVNDLYNLATGLQDIVDKELPIKMAFAVQKNAKAVNDELAACDALRKKIADKYKEKVNDDGSIKLKEDKIVDFNKDINELMQQEVNVELTKLSIDELSKCVDALKPKTLMLLDSILSAE